MKEESGKKLEAGSWELEFYEETEVRSQETGGVMLRVSSFGFRVGEMKGGIHRKGGKDAMIFLFWDGILRAGRLGGERGLVPWKIRGKWGLARL